MNAETTITAPDQLADLIAEEKRLRHEWDVAELRHKVDPTPETEAAKSAAISAWCQPYREIREAVASILVAATGQDLVTLKRFL